MRKEIYFNVWIEQFGLLLVRWLFRRVSTRKWLLAHGSGMCVGTKNGRVSMDVARLDG